MSSGIDGNWRNDRSVLQSVIESHGSLVRSISATLFESDPEGINYEDNTDEYDPEAQTIVIRLLKEGVLVSLERVREIVIEEFEWWFGDIDGDEQYAAISSEVHRLYQRDGEGSEE